MKINIKFEKIALKYEKQLNFIGDPFWYNKTDADESGSKWWTSFTECPLLNIDSDYDKVRLITEMIQLIGAFLYIVAALREMKFLGYHMFIENLVRI